MKPMAIDEYVKTYGRRVSQEEVWKNSMAYREFMLKQIRELVYEGRSVTEIADILDLKPTQVRSSLVKEEMR